MIVERIADALNIGDHADSERLQERRRSDARQLQQLRRIESSRSDNHFGIGSRIVFAVPSDIFDGSRTPPVEENACGKCVRNYFEIGAPPRRLEIAGRGRGARSIAHGSLVIASAFLNRTVEILVAGISALQCRRDVGFGERMAVA
jgi:hypothetical protein